MTLAPSRLSRRLLTLYSLLLAFVGFWPTPVDKPAQGTLDSLFRFLHRRGFPDWFGYNLLESSANAMLFVPVGILAALSFPGSRWWHNAGIGMLASLCIELGQMLFLEARYPSWFDVAANTLGTILGVAGVRLWRRRPQRSHRAR
ncbi:VanZ family protein [Arthrobacter cavernae]|uniref:VanZ family protein n=1 Tax=Arthrobacter cavernae TaxID=2817681 RepID=A0A939HGZ5_9MICC|nr:VanZ family protein [Arthrobacter cavernae]MBO1267701.1 VanZ family protein [Arthrobacter cavernae]